MIIEPELGINAENNINNENIPSFENQQNKKKLSKDLLGQYKALPSLSNATILAFYILDQCGMITEVITLRYKFEMTIFFKKTFSSTTAAPT